MVREVFRVGEMAMVDPGYHSGIWLRTEQNLAKSRESNRVSPGSRLLVLEIRNDDILVVGEGGVVGWTWTNRLKHLE